MRIIPGSVYDIMVLHQPQGTPSNLPRFVCEDVYEVDGQYMVIGRKPVHQQEIYSSGFQDIPERLSCFVILPGADAVEIARVVELLKGFPLALKEGADLLFIVNWATRVPGISDGHSNDRDVLLGRARKVVEVCLHLREKGKPPPWFEQAKIRDALTSGRENGVRAM